MPLYEYQCQSCGATSEVIQRLSDPPLESCERCGGDLKKLISAPAFQFRGTGWYVTDYAGKGKGGDSKEKAQESGSEKSETKESKSGAGTSGSGSPPAKADSSKSGKATSTD